MDDHDRRKYIRAYVIRNSELRRVGTADVCISCGMPAATRDRRKRDIEPTTSHVTGPAQAPIAICGYPAAAKFADAIYVPPMAATRPARENDLRSAARALLAAWDASPSGGCPGRTLCRPERCLGWATRDIPADHPRKPQDTKQAQVLAMLRRTRRQRTGDR